jgi:hypothetical protein
MLDEQGSVAFYVTLPYVWRNLKQLRQKQHIKKE